MEEHDEAKAWDPEINSEIEARLRHDAMSWGGEPSAASMTRLHATLATLATQAQPSRQRAVRLPLAAAAALAVTLVLWCARESMPSESSQLAVSGMATGMVESMQRELAAVTADANAIAMTLFEPVSRGFGGLFGQGVIGRNPEGATSEGGR